jgi:hypothetical protein
MMKRLFLLSALAFVCSLLAATGCEESDACTAAGCGPSRLKLDTEGWAPGEYEIELRYTLGGDQAFVCTLSVDDPQASEHAGDDAGPSGYESTCRQTKGTSRSVQLYPSAHMGPAIEVFDAPDEVQLVLRTGDQTLFDDTITLEHETSYPNGPDCGACRSASMTLTLQ